MDRRMSVLRRHIAGAPQGYARRVAMDMKLITFSVVEGFLGQFQKEVQTPVR